MRETPTLESYLQQIGTRIGMSRAGYKSNKGVLDGIADHNEYATRPTTAEGFGSVSRGGVDELRWSSLSGKGGRGLAEDGRDGAGPLGMSGYESQHTGAGRSNERSEFANNTTLKGRKSAQKFLDDINCHEKQISSAVIKNRNQDVEGLKKYSNMNKGGFSFSKGRHNDLTPDEDLMAELGASKSPKELDNNIQIEDSFFKHELFKPAINARSLEIAEANPKWKRIDKRFRDEVAQKVKRIKQLAKEVAQERKEKEFEVAKRSSSTKSLKSKSNANKALVEGMDTYSRNKIWAEQKKLKLEQAQKQQKMKELEQELPLTASTKPSINMEDPNLLVARKAGTGSHLSQMAFPLRQQTHQTRRAAAISSLSVSLQAKSCPFAPRTNALSPKITKNTPPVETKPTAASQLRAETNKARIQHIRDQMLARKAAEEQEQTHSTKNNNRTGDRTNTNNERNNNRSVGRLTVSRTSAHLYRSATVKKLFADVKGGVSPSASVAPKLYRSTYREAQRSPNTEKKPVTQLSNSRSNSRLRFHTPVV